jgi:hypothetical protein
MSAVPHPADQFRNSIADWLRQDFLQTRSEGGSAGAQKWIANHSQFFQNTDPTGPFAKLKSELDGLNQADQAADLMQNVHTPRSLDEIQKSQSQLYLDGDPGLKIEAALRGQDPYTGMKNLINTVRQDPTGQAFNGLVRDMFDRTLVASKVIDGARGNYYYSGVQARRFLNQYQGAFDAIKEADPAIGSRLQRVINALDKTDQITRNPNAVFTSPDGGISSVSPTALGITASQFVGARVGRYIPSGGIQGPAIASNFFKRTTEQLFNKMGVETQEKLIRDMLLDKRTFQTMTTPLTSQEAADRVGALLQKYIEDPNMRATAVQIGQAAVNPETRGPQTRPDIQTIGGPRAPGYLQPGQSPNQNWTQGPRGLIPGGPTQPQQPQPSASPAPGGAGSGPSGSWLSAPSSFAPSGAGPIGSAFSR